MIIKVVTSSELNHHDLRPRTYIPEAAIAYAELEIARHDRTIARLQSRQHNLRAEIAALQQRATRTTP